MVLPALLVVVVSLVGYGCSTVAHRNNDPTAAPERTVVVGSGDFGREIAVQVGDVLRVERPADHAEWDLAYATEVLRSLNTDEGRRRPLADGWTFAVVAAGTTDLSLSPILSRGGTPNVQKFVVTITAK